MRPILLALVVSFVVKEVQGWGYKDGVLHNSIWLGKFAFLKRIPLTETIAKVLNTYGFLQRGDLQAAA